MSGSGIRWAICKSASRSRQITMPVPHHSSFLQARCPSSRRTNSVEALKASLKIHGKWFERRAQWQPSKDNISEHRTTAISAHQTNSKSAALHLVPVAIDDAQHVIVRRLPLLQLFYSFAQIFLSSPPLLNSFWQLTVLELKHLNVHLLLSPIFTTRWMYSESIL